MRYSLYCQALQPEELFDLPGNDVHKFCSGFNACPCDVRCDKKPVAVREAAKRLSSDIGSTHRRPDRQLVFHLFPVRFLNLLPRRSDHVPDLRRSRFFFFILQKAFKFIRCSVCSFKGACTETISEVSRSVSRET